MHTEHEHIDSEFAFSNEEGFIGAEVFPVSSESGLEKITRDELVNELATAETELRARGDENKLNAAAELAPVAPPDTRAVIMETYGGTEADWAPTGPAFTSGTYLINGVMTGEPSGIDATKGKDLLASGNAEAVEQNQEMIQALERDGYFAKDFKNGEGAFVAYLDETRQIVYENFERVNIEEEAKPEETENQLAEVQPRLDTELSEEPASEEDVTISLDEAVESPLIQINLTEAVRQTVPEELRIADEQAAEAITEPATLRVGQSEEQQPVSTDETARIEVVAPAAAEVARPAELELPINESVPALNEEVSPSLVGTEPAVSDPVKNETSSVVIAETPEITESAPTVAEHDEVIGTVVAVPSTVELSATTLQQESATAPSSVGTEDESSISEAATKIHFEPIATVEEPVAPSISNLEDIRSTPTSPQESVAPAIVAPEMVPAATERVDLADGGVETPSEANELRATSLEPASREAERDLFSAELVPAASPLEQPAAPRIEIQEPARLVEDTVSTELVQSAPAKTAPVAREFTVSPSNETAHITNEIKTPEITAEVTQRMEPVEANGTVSVERSVRDEVADQATIPVVEQLAREDEQSPERRVTAETYAFLEEHGLPRPPLRFVQTAGIEAARARRGVASMVAAGIPTRRRPVVSLRDVASGITLQRAA